MNFTSYKGFYHRIKPTLYLKQASREVGNIQGSANPLGQITLDGKGTNIYGEKEDPTVEDFDKALQDFSHSIVNHMKESNSKNKTEKKTILFIDEAQVFINLFSCVLFSKFVYFSFSK